MLLFKTHYDTKCVKQRDFYFTCIQMSRKITPRKEASQTGKRAFGIVASGIESVSVFLFALRISVSFKFL